MNLLKRFIPQLCLLGIICLIAAFSYVKIEFVDANTTINTAPIIIIDAGHEALENTIKTPKIIAKQVL